MPHSTTSRKWWKGEAKSAAVADWLWRGHAGERVNGKGLVWVCRGCSTIPSECAWPVAQSL